MMGDGSYYDMIVKVENRGKRIVIRYALFAICIILLLASVAVLRSIFAFILAVAIDSVLLFITPSNKVEYEYVFVDGQLDFDRIIGGSSRKNMFRTDLENAIIVAPYGSHSLDGHKNLKERDFSSNSELREKDFVIVTKEEKGQSKVIFTPDETMLKEMKEKAPFKIELEKK
ncbi:MAG: DUF6106 family protein [Lachnospiraceae bacterium]|nr:DUF6106 family protein [Lachnospiraceae bacterium]